MGGYRDDKFPPPTEGGGRGQDSARCHNRRLRVRGRGRGRHRLDAAKRRPSSTPPSRRSAVRTRHARRGPGPLPRVG